MLAGFTSEPSSWTFHLLLLIIEVDVIQSSKDQ